VLTDKAIKILTQVYNLSETKIVMIPHGAPDVPFLDTSYYKDNFQAEDRQVLMTFGLLNPNKGIEYVINALPPIVKKYPQVLYIILGATHPNVKRDHGEKYRVFLERRVNELGLGKNIIFHNRFVSLERLIHFLVATDIYITPYLVREQISSGTCDRGILICSTGVGMSIVANKFPHVRAALCADVATARQSREHIDANVLVLAGSNLTVDEARLITTAWLETPFEGGRHQKRLDIIKMIEKDNFKETA